MNPIFAPLPTEVIVAQSALFLAMRETGSSGLESAFRQRDYAISLLESMAMIPGTPTTTQLFLVCLPVSGDSPDTAERPVQANVASIVLWSNLLGSMGISIWVNWNPTAPRILLDM